MRSALTLPVTDSVCGIGGTTRFFGRAGASLPRAPPAPLAGIPPSGIPIGIVPAEPPVDACRGSGSPPVGVGGGVDGGPVDGTTPRDGVVGPPAA